MKCIFFGLKVYMLVFALMAMVMLHTLLTAFVLKLVFMLRLSENQALHVTCY